MVPTSSSPRFRRARASFSGKVWCPWLRISVDSGIKYLYNFDSKDLGKLRREYLSSDLGTRILAKIGGVGFQHNFLVKNLWGLIWRGIIGLSGLPDLPRETEIFSEPEYEELSKDVVVIGSDPSAVIVANELSSRRSLDILLIYRESDMYSDIRVKIDSSVERLDDTDYLGFFEDGYLFINRSRRKIYRMNIRKIIFATGTRETYPVFKNNDLPGIISSDLFLRLVNAGCDLDGKKIVVLGSGWWGRYIASKALEKRARITMLTPEDSVDSDVGYELISGVEEVVGVGYPVIRGLRFRSRGSRGFVEAGLVVSALHRQPIIEPILQLKAEPAYSEYLDAVTIFTDMFGETSVKNIYAVGEVTGSSREDLVREAELFTKSFLRRDSLSVDEKEELKSIYSKKRIVNFGSKMITKKPRFYLGGEDVSGLKFVCLCEDIILSDILRSYDQGYETLEKLKRYTALGTGSCQGRWCKYTSLILLSYFRKKPLGSIGLIRQRPPLEPVEVGLLGGLMK